MSHDPGTTARRLTERQALDAFPMTHAAIESIEDVQELIRFARHFDDEADHWAHQWVERRIAALRGK